MEKQIITFLQKNINLSVEEITALDKLNNSIRLPKGAFLIKQGAFCKNFYFVEKGLLRQYSTDKIGKEHIIHFAAESWFVGDRDGAFFNAPAVYNIQCLEPSILFELNDAFFDILRHNDSYIDFMNKMLHNHVRHLQKRINQLLSATAEERYLSFIEMYPNIMQRVPQAMVAAYLGIAPESLSRVRKELANKK